MKKVNSQFSISENNVNVVTFHRGKWYNPTRKEGSTINNIKVLRQERGWTQAELGQRLKVKDSAISKYENGSLQLSGDLLVQLADIFGVSTDYILGRTKYRTYEGTSFEVPKIIDLLSRGDMEMISNWAELSPENQARIADYAKILQKAEAADKNKK